MKNHKKIVKSQMNHMFNQLNIAIIDLVAYSSIVITILYEKDQV